MALKYEEVIASFPSFSKAHKKHMAEVACLHQETFPALKEELQGKEIVITGSGPTINFYKQIPNAIHIGQNASIFLRHINFDYSSFCDYFDHLYLGARMHPNPNLKIIFGRVDDFCNMYTGKINNAYNYFYEFNRQSKDIFTVDVLNETIAFSPTTVLALMQILLWCSPKTIYLAGFDSSGGWHKGNYYYSSLVRLWSLLKGFKEKFYPDIKIISVNPRGLKGMFEDIYQNAHAVSALDNYEKGEQEAACKDAEAALEEDVDNLPLRHEMGKLLLKYKPKRAQDLIKGWIRDNPAWAKGEMLLAQDAHKKGDYADALVHGRRALEIDPSDLHIRMWNLWRLHENEDTKGLNELLNSAPAPKLASHFWAYELFLRATDEYHKFNYKKSEFYYKKAIAQNPHEQRYRTRLAQLYLSQFRHTDAEKIIKSGFKHIKSWLDGYRYISWIRERQQRYLEALDYLNKALHLKPYCTTAWATFHHIMGCLGKNADAREIIQNIKDCVPSNPDPWHWEASIHKREKNWAEAEKCARKAVELINYEENTSRLFYREELIDILGKLGRDKDALQVIEEGLKIDAGWIKGYVLKGRMLLANNEHSAALLFAENALANKPSDPQLQLFLAEVRTAIGKQANSLIEDNYLKNPEWKGGFDFLLKQALSAPDQRGSLKKFESYLRDAPFDTRASYAKNLSKSSPAAACSLYHVLLRENPKWFDGWFELSELYFSLRNHKSSYDCAKRARALNGGHKWLLVRISATLRYLEKYEEACELTQSLLLKYPNWSLSWREYALFLDKFASPLLALNAAAKAASLDDSDRKLAKNDCLMVAEKACRDNPTDAGAWLEYARICEIFQAHPKAMECLRKAMELEPENREFRRRLASLYKKNGQGLKALLLRLGLGNKFMAK